MHFGIQIWTVAILFSIPLWIWSSVNCVCGFHFQYVPKDLSELHKLPQSVLGKKGNFPADSEDDFEGGNISIIS